MLPQITQRVHTPANNRQHALNNRQSSYTHANNRIANCDDYITSNLLGIDLNSLFGKIKMLNDVNTAGVLLETVTSYPSRAHEFISGLLVGSVLFTIFISVTFFVMLEPRSWRGVLDATLITSIKLTVTI
jgi:hypothetical protein